MTAVLGAYLDVQPEQLGRRPTEDYPRELRGPRPTDWGAREARRGERDYEYAACDVAGPVAAMS